MMKNTLIHLIDAKLNLLDIVLKLFALNYPKKNKMKMKMNLYLLLVTISLTCQYYLYL